MSWICKKCETENPDTCVVCEVCDFPRDIIMGSDSVCVEPKNNSSIIWILVFIIVGLIMFILFTWEAPNSNRQITNTDYQESLEKTPHSYNMRGYIGSYPITMQIKITGEVVEGSYYYDSGSSNLQLFGTFVNGIMKLGETTNAGRPSGYFKGTFINSEYTGDFYNYQGKHFDFRIKVGN